MSEPNLWTGNKKLDELRSAAASSGTGCIYVSIEELNAILPNHSMNEPKQETAQSSTTPESDAMWTRYNTHKGDGGDIEGPGDFGRRMERERNQALKRVEELEADRKVFVEFYKGVKAFSESTTAISCFGLGFLAAILYVAEKVLSPTTGEKNEG